MFKCNYNYIISLAINHIKKKTIYSILDSRMIKIPDYNSFVNQSSSHNTQQQCLKKSIRSRANNYNS